MPRQGTDTTKLPRYICLDCATDFSYPHVPQNGINCLVCQGHYVRWINAENFCKGLKVRADELHSKPPELRDDSSA